MFNDMNSKDDVRREVGYSFAALRHWIFNKGCGLPRYNRTREYVLVPELSADELNELEYNIGVLEAHIVALLESKFEEVA